MNYIKLYSILPLKNTFSCLLWLLLAGLILLSSCHSKTTEKQTQETLKKKEVTAKDILGHPAYRAISFGGYREKSREQQPTLSQLKEDLKLLSAMGIKVLRTYNVQLPHASNVLKAIAQLKEKEPGFEMYVMLGAWIDCKNAWTDKAPDHELESAQNEGEIDRAIALSNQYPDIVKILAVGNEAMVKWAESYYVQPEVILKWVNHLQRLKEKGHLPAELWITSSDDFASWGGGGTEYQTESLNQLIHAVDYISMHTYPYHNTHYNPDFWLLSVEEEQLPLKIKVDTAMMRAKQFAVRQYEAVKAYMKSVGADKPIHIGETGWATVSDGFYGNEGSRATDEYKQSQYYHHMRNWADSAGISIFYFEAFDEQWKDAGNPVGSENHFGLFTLEGKAKYALWEFVESGTFEGLSRGGNEIVKTYGGNKDSLMSEVKAPPTRN